MIQDYSFTQLHNKEHTPKVVIGENYDLIGWGESVSGGISKKGH